MPRKQRHIEGLTILLVEDHAPLLRNLAFLLEVTGFDVITAGSGSQALQALSARSADLIISDIDMPDMNGLELLGQVRGNARWAHIPFICAPDCYDLDDVMVALSLGADDYLPKPYDIYDVLDAIKRTLPQPVLNRLPAAG